MGSPYGSSDLWAAATAIAAAEDLGKIRDGAVGAANSLEASKMNAQLRALKKSGKLSTVRRG